MKESLRNKIIDRINAPTRQTCQEEKELLSKMLAYIDVSEIATHCKTCRMRPTNGACRYGHVDDGDYCNYGRI